MWWSHSAQSRLQHIGTSCSQVALVTLLSLHTLVFLSVEWVTRRVRGRDPYLLWTTEEAGPCEDWMVEMNCFLSGCHFHHTLQALASIFSR